MSNKQTWVSISIRYVSYPYVKYILTQTNHKVLSSRLWLVVTALDRTALEPQFVMYFYVLFFLLEFHAGLAKQGSYLNKSVIYFNFLLPHHLTCGILVLQPGIKPASPALEAQS